MGSYIAAILDPRRASAPGLPADGAWWERLETGYDLGWQVADATSSTADELVLEHTGMIWGGNAAAVLAPRRRAGVAVLLNSGAERAGPIARAILRSTDGAPLPPPSKAAPWETPDTWAAAFLAAAAALLLGCLAHGKRATGQLRRGEREWRPTAPGIARAAVLAGLAAETVRRAFLAAGPPPEALPATVAQALPVLALSASALLVLAAATGLAPRRAR